MASLYDSANVLCLDARNQVRFTLAGSGKLIDNMGTTHASRVLQLTNGTASISVDMGSASTAGKNASCVVGITARGSSSGFHHVIRRQRQARELDMMQLTRRTFCCQAAACLTHLAFADAPALPTAMPSSPVRTAPGSSRPLPATWTCSRAPSPVILPRAVLAAYMITSPRQIISGPTQRPGWQIHQSRWPEQS